MVTRSDYRIREQLHKSTNSLVYRGYQVFSEQPVVLKMLADAYPPPERIAWFKREYEMTRQVQQPGIIKACDLITGKVETTEALGDRLIMVLEDFGGDSLSLLGLAGNLGLAEFLKLAIAITQCLEQLHGVRIIHKDINPSNIVFNPASGQVKLIDLGISTMLSSETQSFTNPRILEGTLAYISPEQTGRMNRAIDYRTDFYSLGVTFYELLVGELPFHSHEAIELVHSHIAKQPAAPHEVRTQLSPVLSEIILKLMAKNAEERYQSARGIQRDLEYCLHQLQTTNSVTFFSLGCQDVSGKFQIPQKLYGREAEIDRLLKAFARSCSGTSELVLVAGYSGVGKSALVKEVYKPITAKRGNFIAGKFDQYQRDIPYYAISQAFNQLGDRLVAESEDIFNDWKQKILTAVGHNGQVLIDVIPHLEFVIGPQPEIAKVGPQEAQNRFNLVCKRFIEAISTPAHPLVLFIDDLQWADGASLNLIRTIISDRDLHYLLVIGAYRYNEVEVGHPLTLALNDLQKDEGIIETIALQNLTPKDVNLLVSETLVCTPNTVQNLTDLIYEKTAGNAFFTTEFLKSLYLEGSIAFIFPSTSGSSTRKEQGQWQWDVQLIQAKNITDNVVRLMAGKINILTEVTKDLLKLAACIGNTFDLSTLAIISQQPTKQVLENLFPALQEGLVFPLDENYKLLILGGDEIGVNAEFSFQHDRVQQAAYSLIDDRHKQATHLQIGRLLLASTAPEKLAETIFDIVNQLNEGIEIIKDKIERLELAELNLIAGKKAKLATAYGPAVKYLNVALELLKGNAWESQYNLTLSIYLESVESNYLNVNYQQAERLSKIVLERANTLLDRIRVCQTKILFYAAQNRMKDAIDTALETLEELEVSLVKTPPQNLQIETLYDLPEMTDRYKQAALRILMMLFAPAYTTNPPLLPLISFTMVDLCIKYGTDLLSAYAYGLYGLLLCGSLGNIEAGYEFGKLALRSLEKFDSREIQCRVYNKFYSFISHWKEAARTTIEPLRQTIKIGLETGEIEFACYASVNYCANLSLIGEPLEPVREQHQHYLELIENLKQEFQLYYTKIWGQFVLNLTNRAENKTRLIGSLFDERTMLPILIENNNLSSLYCFYLTKTILNTLLKNYPEAVTNGALAEANEPGVVGLFVVTQNSFYYSLALLGSYPTAKHQEKTDYLEKVAANQSKLKSWAEFAPMNFQHKYDLVEAEKARVLGKVVRAMNLYELAIKGAEENGYLHEEALAYELAGEFYLKRGMEKIAKTYLKEAHYAYRRWQAVAKAIDLEQRYPQFLALQCSPRSKPTAKTTESSSGNTLATLDLTSILKASQILSSEMVLETLLTKLMKVAIENAGAEKGYLILPSPSAIEGEKKWAIAMRSPIAGSKTTDSEAVQRLQLIPIETENESNPGQTLCHGIINYVIHTRESIVLNDAATEGNFTGDPYIIQQRPKSILCLPLLKQNELTGILYLENNLTVGAFTGDRLEVLNLLSSQAAISIENANLYTRLEEYSRMLEQKVEQRTAELSAATQEAQKARTVAEEALKAKSTFLASMSHELRSPLNAILGFSQLTLRSPNLPAEHQENLKIVNRSGEHLLTLIDDVLDMSKIEAGRTTLNEQNFDLYCLLDDLEDMFRLKAEDKGLQLVFNRTPNIPQYVRTDPIKLRQVSINLINNALKFTQEGSVSVRVRRGMGNSQLEKVQTNEDRPCSIVFEVEDTGPGIPVEELDKIFEPFVQTKTGQQALQGTGLGLPIAREFVKLMGGELTVSSQVGRGSIFKFDIKIGIASAAEIEGDRPTHHIIALEPNQLNYRILVVDDRSCNRQLLIELLSPLGFEVREASNGREAVEIFQTWQPHLIWMDMQMPVMDGCEATKQIKATVEGQSTAVIALTAGVLEDERAIAISAGCDDFIRKPFRNSDIFATMNKHIGVRYIYEEAATTSLLTEAKFEEVMADTLGTLPPKLLTTLEQATLNCDLEEINRLIEEIYNCDSDIAQGLERLAANFKYDEILNFIQQTKRQL